MKKEHLASIMREHLQKVRPELPRERREELIAVAIATGEKAKKTWTPRTRMPREAYVARWMRNELLRHFFRFVEDDEGTTFVIPTDPHDVMIANRPNDEDEDTRIHKIFADERDEHVHAVLAKMPEDERVILLLYYFDGMGLEEIGRQKGISKSWVCRLLQKAQNRFLKLYLRMPENTKLEVERAGKVFRTAYESLERLQKKLKRKT